jgi:hypothetical protein
MAMFKYKVELEFEKEEGVPLCNCCPLSVVSAHPWYYCELQGDDIGAVWPHMDSLLENCPLEEVAE